MRQSLAPLLAFAVLGLAACRKDAVNPPSAGLEGTWRLTNRQCYCPPGPVPNEQVTFSGQQVVFYRNGLVARAGQYTVTTAPSACLGPNSTVVPALSITYSTGNTTPQYTLAGNTLTLDYGGPCDAPVDTYERTR